MKAFINIARVVVGVLFIFSGLIKANDPLGLSYKMQEFFEVWNMHFLNDYTLAFSVLMITFEIIAGVAVLLGWRMNLFSWLLLLLIIFFTFLTGYALFSGKIRECGCFGDCIPLQAKQSFMKDLLLLVLILFIFPYRNKIKPLLTSTASAIILVLTTVFSIGLQWYVLKHLPIIDCLPYKAGNNIPEKMKAPPGSIPDSTVIMFTYEKNGKQQSFTADGFPDDFDDSYTFVKREDKVVRKGTAVAAIRDFALQTESGTDTTLALLNEPGLKLFIFIKDGYKEGEWVDGIKKLSANAASKGIKSFVVTNLENLSLFPGIQVLRTDGTAIKTAARHNPSVFLIDGGTIVKKWSVVDIDETEKYLNQLK
ncbi:MAG: DoxX family protein [Chitinophagaceae bacterium]|nr:DoxX family protein [Chitinophagaceae bacterium]